MLRLRCYDVSMSTGTLISAEEYLATSFPDGDRDYLEGQILERNIGEVPHSDLQTGLVVFFRLHYPKFWAGVEVRVQVKARRFRVPDVCLIAGDKPKGRIVTEPPFLVVEVLSPEDRMVEMQERIDDYLAFGVKYVWIVDPSTRRGYVHTSEGSREAKDGVLRTDDPRIEVPLSELSI
jgi:Uma2 family endonuclease